MKQSELFSGPPVDGGRLFVRGSWRAVFVMPHVSLGTATAERAADAHSKWERLVSALPAGAFDWHTFVAPLSTTEVLETELRAVDGGLEALPALPGWSAQMSDSAERVESLPGVLVKKVTLLVVTLPEEEGEEEPEVTEDVASVERGLAGGPRLAGGLGRFGVSGRGGRARRRRAPSDAVPVPLSSGVLPSFEDRLRARERSEELLATLRRIVEGVRLADEGLVRWWAAHDVSFGGYSPPASHQFFRQRTQGAAVLRPMCEAELNFGGARPRKFIRVRGPVIQDEFFPHPERGAEQEVYQAFFIMNDHPSAWVYPGGSLVERLDRLGFVYRLMVSSRPVANDVALRKFDAEFATLRDVHDEISVDAAPNERFKVAAADLTMLHSRMSDDSKPRLFPSTVVIGVGARSAKELASRVAALEEMMGGPGTYLSRPSHGMQTQLWASLLPGGPELPAGYERELLAADWAGLGLFHAPSVGCDRGKLIGCVAPKKGVDGILYPVFFDPTMGPRVEDDNMGATFACVGDQGGGKTYFIKCAVDLNLSLGGGFFALDRSPEGEWTRASHAWGRNRISVVSFSDPSVRLDPIEVFLHNAPEKEEDRRLYRVLAERHTLGFLALVLSLDREKTPYAVLAQAVRLLVHEDFPVKATLPNLLTVLAAFAGKGEAIRSAGDPDLCAERLGGELGAAADLLLFQVRSLRNSSAYGGSLFGSSEASQVLDLTADGIVFQAPGLKLDSDEGRALTYLTGAYALAFMGATDRPNLVALAEFAGLAADPHGRVIVSDMVRLTRRLGGIAMTDNQDVESYTDHGLDKFFISRLIFKVQHAASEKVLRFADMGVSGEARTQVESLTTTLCGYRDPLGRSEIVQIFQHWNPFVHELFRTDQKRRPVHEVLEELSST